MTPKKAQAILAKHGTIVTEREAKIIAEFLYKLAEISVKIFMDSNKENEFDSCRAIKKWRPVKKVIFS